MGPGDEAKASPTVTLADIAWDLARNLLIVTCTFTRIIHLSWHGAINTQLYSRICYNIISCTISFVLTLDQTSDGYYKYAVNASAFTMEVWCGVSLVHACPQACMHGHSTVST